MARSGNKCLTQEDPEGRKMLTELAIQDPDAFEETSEMANGALAV